MSGSVSCDIAAVVGRMRALESALDAFSPKQISTEAEAEQLRDVTMRLLWLKWRVERHLSRRSVVVIHKPSAIETGVRFLILAIFYRSISVRA